jgi:hypothetical protein
MSDEKNNSVVQKTITLTKLKPSEYRLWAVQAKSTLDVQNCLNVVFSREVDPTVHHQTALLLLTLF